MVQRHDAGFVLLLMQARRDLAARHADYIYIELLEGVAQRGFRGFVEVEDGDASRTVFGIRRARNDWHKCAIINAPRKAGKSARWFVRMKREKRLGRWWRSQTSAAECRCRRSCQ